MARGAVRVSGQNDAIGVTDDKWAEQQQGNQEGKR
jgi:hypothetical protein